MRNQTISLEQATAQTLGEMFEFFLECEPSSARAAGLICLKHAALDWQRRPRHAARCVAQAIRLLEKASGVQIG